MSYKPSLEKTTIADLDDWRKKRNDIGNTAKLYAVLDACDEPFVLNLISNLPTSSTVCLYAGKASLEHREIAPYLVLVDDAVLRSIEDNLLLSPWGFFLFSCEDIVPICRHLRRYLTVKGPDNERLYFRFYDPRVLDEYLISCESTELREFFGPVSVLVAIDSNGGFLYRCINE